jgi:hypothetical protein
MTTGSVSHSCSTTTANPQVWQNCRSHGAPPSANFRDKIRGVSVQGGGPSKAWEEGHPRSKNAGSATGETAGRPGVLHGKPEGGQEEADLLRGAGGRKTREPAEPAAPEDPGRDAAREETLDDTALAELANCEWVDPTARALLQWAPPPGSVIATPSGVPSQVLDQVALQLVRKVSVGQSTVHLQLGDGQLAGGAVLVTAGADGLDIRITAPAGVDAAEFAKAVEQRLLRRGLRIANLEVD